MRFALRAVLLLVVAFGAQRLWLALRSPEERIRARIEDAQDGFNGSRLSPCMALFAPEFVDETSGLHRDDVRAVLVHVFFEEVDPKTGSLRFRVSFDELEILAEAKTATAAFTVRLAEREGESWRDAWAFRLEGELFEGEEGWAFERARFRTLQGDIPE